MMVPSAAIWSQMPMAPSAGPETSGPSRAMRYASDEVEGDLQAHGEGQGRTEASDFPRQGTLEDPAGAQVFSARGSHHFFLLLSRRKQRGSIPNAARASAVSRTNRSVTGSL